MQLSFYSMMLVASGVSGGMSGASKLLHDYSSDGQGMAMTFSGASPTLRITDTTTPSNNWDSGLGTGYTVQDFFKSRSFTSYTGPVSSGKSLMQADGYIKPCRHNLNSMSNRASSAAWSKQNASVVAKTAISVPSVGSGTTTDALRMVVGNVQPAIYQSFTLPANITVTLSAYCYAGTTPYVGLNLYGTSGSYAIAVFDLSAGAGSATETFVGATSGTIYATAITDAGGGWYRISMTASIASTTAYSFFQLAEAATGNTINLGQLRKNGAAGTEDAYFWGMQTNNGYLLDYVSSEAHNLAVRSAEINSYTGVETTVSANADTAPDGTASVADRIVESVNADRHIRYVTLASAIVGVPHTYSVYLKQGTRRYAQVVLADSSNVRYGLVVDLQTGTVGTITSDSSPTQTSYTVTAVANGYYRISTTMAPTATTLYSIIALSDSLTPSYTSGSPTYTGDGSSYITAWGGQLELSSSPGKYVATTAAAVYNQHFDIPVEYNTDVTVKALTREEARTNLVLYNTAFDNAAWTETNIATISAGSVTAPNGVAEAETLTASAGAAAHRVQNTSALTISTGDYAWSAYVKAGTHNYVVMNHQIGSEQFISAVFDLGGGGTTATETDVGTTTGTIVSTFQQSVGNGWYRIGIIGSLTTSVACTFTVGFAQAATGNTFSAFGSISWTAVGTETFHIWGAQVEAGSTASSVIATGSAAVTRAADDIRLSTAIFPLDASLGTAYVKGYITAAGGTQGAFTINDNTINERIDHRAGGGQIGFTDGGVSQTSITVGGWSANTTTKFAIAYQLNDIAAVKDGGTVQTDASATIPTVYQVILGGLDTGSAYMTGGINEFAYFPTRLADATLQTLTTA